MALRTSMGQLLVNEALPDDMRDHSRVLDKKGINALLRELAQRHPEKYVEVSHKLNTIGRDVATQFGGYTFGLEHLQKAKAGQGYVTQVQAALKSILANTKLTPEQRHAAIIKATGNVQQRQIDDIYDEAVKANNPLALQVVSGSRGNKMNLATLLGSDMLYADHRDEVIPLPVTHSYSQGLRPVEYWAATYGARKGTLATKFAVQNAGFLNKQLNQVAHRLMVVDEDDERDTTNRGLPVDTDDDDNEGALLAQDVGPYKRNTVLTPKIMRHLKGLGHDRLLVRSPVVGGSPDGGVYARDVGVREHGVLPSRGSQVGLTAAQALSEPLSQGMLSTKHSGGVAGQEKSVGGFQTINQLVQVPKKFKGGAAHAEYDGTVTRIEPAPAGGSYVYIDSQRHYVPSDVDVNVKKGDVVEAGDVLSSGFPNPATITEHKGLGEGRRYFVNAYKQAMKDSGMRVNRRNVELISRGLINHVRLTDEFADHVPDDVLPYSTVEHIYQPREGHVKLDPARATGKYLEQPILHYTIGTRLRPSVLKDLQHFGVKEVTVHDEPPPFKTEMVRGMYSLQHDPDWMTRMYGSGLKGSLLDATHRGAVSDELGTSFVPSLARAVDFGQIGAVRTPEPLKPLPPEGQPVGDKKPIQQIGPAAGLFKLSGDARAKAIMNVRGTLPMRDIRLVGAVKPARQIKLAQTPASPKVDTTTPSYSGSSSAAPVTKAAPVAGFSSASPAGAGTQTQPRLPAAGNPANNLPTKPNVPPQQIQLPTATTSAPAGQIHPARQPQALQPDPWQASPSHGSPLQPPKPQGLFNSIDDPEMAANFVQGNGFGGDVGALMRFGSLFDTGAVGSLTSGSNPIRYHAEGEYNHDLLGGNYTEGPTAQEPVAQGPAVAPQVSSPPAVSKPVTPTLNIDARKAVAQHAKWEQGNPEFDALRANSAKEITDDQIRQHLFDSNKRMMLFERQGVVPGKPAFEELRKKLHGEVLAKVGGNIDQAIMTFEQALQAWQAQDPEAPEVAQLQAQIQGLKNVKEKGISDDDVFEHMKTMTPEGDMSDYDVLANMRGHYDLAHIAERAFASPVTAPAAMKATAGIAKPILQGSHQLLTKTPLINKVPGFRPVAKKVFQAGEEAALKAATQKLEQSGLRYALKKLPSGIGIGLEVYYAMDTPADELRAKFNDKVMQEPTLKNLGWSLLDNALNPGQNLRAVGIAGNDASKMVQQEQWRGQDLAVTRAADLAQRISGQKGKYTPEQIAEFQKTLDDTYAKAPPEFQNTVKRMLQERAESAATQARRAEFEAAGQREAIESRKRFMATFERQKSPLGAVGSGLAITAPTQKTPDLSDLIADDENQPLTAADKQQFESQNLRPGNPAFEEMRSLAAKQLQDNSNELQQFNLLRDLLPSIMAAAKDGTTEDEKANAAKLLKVYEQLQQRYKETLNGTATDDDVYKYLRRRNRQKTNALIGAAKQALDLLAESIVQARM